MLTLKDAAGEVCGSIIGWSSTSSVEDLSTFIANLRRRETPRLGYTRSFINDLCRSATDSQKASARKTIGEALEKDLITGAHQNTITAVGDITLFLGADAEICERIGAACLAAQEKWAEGPWGTTRSICEMLRRLFPLDCCSERSLIPLFAWLNRQIWKEWEWARTWDESLLGNSGHNWWLHTFLGFFEAGLFFPEFKGFKKFQAFAPTYFEREMNVLLEADGFTRERSGYHYGTVNHFIDFLHIATENGIPVSRNYLSKLRLGVEACGKVLTPGGDVPMMGDSGNKHREWPTASSLERLRVQAAEFELPDLKAIAEALDPDWSPRFEGHLISGGKNLIAEFERLQSGPGFQHTHLPLDTVLPDSHYYFIRNGWTRDSDYVALEAGEIGNIVSSHDHTAVFGFELYSRGRAILIDNGSGPYGNTPERNWRVSSASHNVATVDDEDHIPMSELSPEWRWTHTVTPDVDEWLSQKHFAYFSGAHEGYRHLPPERRVASCRRKIFYLRNVYWILIDRFTPETDAEHTYRQHFHVNAECRLEGYQLVTAGRGGNLLIQNAVQNPSVVSPALEPCPFPLDDYDNPRHFTYSSRLSGKHLFVTCLVPFMDENIPRLELQFIDIESDGRILDPWEATALEISINGRRDVYVDMHMQWNLPWQAGGYQGEGRLFHSIC
ncbi:MAG: alginate lyase family protein [Planctomycetota bacterium]|nr:alginate lyase family protein [Planctomycetota bacterium]MDA1140511.1 alginate lyase family protein [Planctomycetota bacterium]